MSRPFAVFDIDGTLIRWQLYHATTDALAKLGYLDTQTYQKIRRARIAWKVREREDSFKAYEKLMIQAFEQIIATLTVKQFERAIDSVVEQYKDQVYTYTRQLISRLKKRGYILLAISGSQRELVERIAKYYGFDDSIGTDYLKNDGKFTGEKKFYAHDKKAALAILVDKHGLTKAGSIAIGDSSSDIPMLEWAERAIAFNPDQQLMAHAKTKGWEIIIERKNVVYRLVSQDGTYQLT